MVLLLEDNADRVARFRAAIARLDPTLRLMVWRSAHAMIREVGPLLTPARLVLLDHDLDPLPGGGDPGDGLEVARHLAAQPIIRPVIVHTSNAERGTRMMGEFELAGWPAARVPPLGESWIEDDWCEVVRRMLAR